MLKRMSHPSPDQVRWTGLAAMVGGALGVLVSPLYSLAYYATDEGEPGAASFWAEPARDLLDPLFTFASPDVGPTEFIDLFRRFYGPTMNAFEAAEKSGKVEELRGQLVELAKAQNQGASGGTSIPATFMRVTVSP